MKSDYLITPTSFPPQARGENDGYQTCLILREGWSSVSEQVLEAYGRYGAPKKHGQREGEERRGAARTDTGGRGIGWKANLAALMSLTESPLKVFLSEGLEGLASRAPTFWFRKQLTCF
jgi:hypothetical protein